MIQKFQLCCPITLKLFQDPVICDDGETYERSAIEDWFNNPLSVFPNDESLRLSPTTGLPISPQLVPNNLVKHYIDGFIENKDNSDTTRRDYEASHINMDDLINSYNEKLFINRVRSRENFNDSNISIEMHGYQQTEDNLTNIYLSLVPPNQNIKQSNVYITVVDTSASMDLPAIHDSNDENVYYSRLDLVKYSLENIVANCDENDYFALIIFSENHYTWLDLTIMDKRGKRKAKEIIYQQEALGGTNIWSGLHAGLEMARSDICKDKNVSVIVLTDGKSTENPPEGVLQCLKNYLNSNPINCSLHTLGYGYEIDCKMLYEIALKHCNGTFCFIPDCYMIGTNVTSLIAKTKSCFANNVQVEIEVENGQWICKLVDDFNIETNVYNDQINKNLEGNKYTINFGTLDCGQKRDFILSVEKAKAFSELALKLNVTYTVNGTARSTQKNISHSKYPCNDIVEIMHTQERNLFIKTLIEIITIKKQFDDDDQNANVKIKNLTLIAVETYKTIDSGSGYFREFSNYKNDYEGQIFKALSKFDWYKKWGYSHLLYLLSSHIRRFNANFKDPSIQQYGGKLYLKFRDECENIFCTLPQPRPSIVSEDTECGKILRLSNVCLNKDADCFSGDSLVTLIDGETKRVCDVQPGDKLRSWNGKSCTVKCVIKSKCWKQRKIAKIGNLLITPYHPIFYNNKWSFPNDVGQITTINCDYLYNMVVDCENVVLVDGYACVTWGHSFTDDVVRHPFFGSNKIIDCLKVMNGWKQGYINIDLAFVSRDKNDGLINGVYQSDNNQMICVQNALLNVY